VDETPRQRYLRTWEALKSDRGSFLSHWQELADYVLPRRSRALSDQPDKGAKRNDKIINDTATRALRTLGAGMMSGITSPSRVWFRYALSRQDSQPSAQVREYLHECEEVVREVLLRSNIYNTLAALYPDLAQFGTAVLFVDEDPQQVVRGHLIPVGQFALGSSANGSIDTLDRRVPMTAVQMAQRFGLARLSRAAREAADKGDRTTVFQVLHVVEPNQQLAIGKADYRGKRWKSCWLKELLLEAGYEEQPFMAPRWSAAPDEVYGYSPGMDCLGDVKALQQLEKRKAELVDKLSRPPLKGPGSLLNRRVSLVPGDFTAVDANATGQTVEPILVVNPAAITAVEQSIREHEGRIKSTYMSDLWLLLSDDERNQRATAAEIQAVIEERLTQVGPVLNRLDNELFTPLLDRVFYACQRRGLLPQPPQELQGSDIRIEYISIAAQAQRIRDLVGIERLVAFIGSLAAGDPRVVDKLNRDKAVDEYAAIVGVKPDLILTEDELARVRAQRAAQEQSQQLAAAATTAVDSAKTLSDTDLSGDNALNRLLGTVPPAAAGLTQSPIPYAPPAGSA
jgi:hypothetical protein